MNEEVKGIARGAGWMLPASLFGNALLFGLDIVVNGVLGTAGYGLFNAVKRVLQIAGFVGLLGMENVVIRLVAVSARRTGEGREGEVSGEAAVRTALAATLFVSAALAFGIAVGPTAAWMGGTRTTLALGALSLPFAAIRTVAVSATQGWGVVRDRALVMFVVWPIAQLLGVGILGSALGLGVDGVVGAYVGAMALGAAWALWGLYRVRPAVFRGGGTGFAAVGALWLMAWPLWAQGLVMALYSWMDQILLEGIRSATDAGVYGPVATLAQLFGVGLGALNNAFAPVIAQKHAEGDSAGLERLYRLVTRWAVAVAVPPLVVCVAVPEAVLAFWPHGSPAAAPALRIICASQLFATGVGSVNYLLIMSGRQTAVLWNGIPAVALNLVLSLTLIPRYGVTGAAVANAVATTAANGIAMGQVWSSLRIHPVHRGLVRVMTAAIPAMGAVTALGMVMQGRSLALVGGVAAGLAFVAALTMLGFEDDDATVLDALRRKLGIAR